MAIQFGTVDGLVNISESIIQLFVHGIGAFNSLGGPVYAKEKNIAYGIAFQRFVEPVYSQAKEHFEIESINIAVYSQNGNEQSPARATFCRKMGLLEINEPAGVFRLTPLGCAILNNDITIQEYAFILLSKLGVFKDGNYVDNVFNVIATYYQTNTVLSNASLLKYLKEKNNDTSFEKTRDDIIINAFTFANLITKIDKETYILTNTGYALIFSDFCNHKSALTPAVLDGDSNYSKYIGALDYGIFDILNKDNEYIYTKIFPNLKKYIKKSGVGNKNDNNTTTLQQIFYGAPGTGKSHEVKKLTGELLDNGEEQDLPNVFRTTFHPDTDYASFVGCYKPTMKPTSKEEKTLTGKDEEIVYEFVPQVFTDAYVYAYNNPSKPAYLVIEEINRGNCAQIFGDLFQLLDRKDGKSEYKIKADKDLAKYLNEAKDKNGQDILTNKEGIKDGKLCLPANLHILATMNTSDQSLFPMDSAFKRRWEWEYVPINYDTNINSGDFEITIGDKSYSWVDFIKQVNKKIFDLTQSEDKQMGNFFIKHSIDEVGFKSKVMFYLWYEVLRDETENNKYFFYGETTDDGKLSKFTFKDLYGDQATDTLQQFMEYLKVTPK